VADNAQIKTAIAQLGEAELNLEWTSCMRRRACRADLKIVRAPLRRRQVDEPRVLRGVGRAYLTEKQHGSGVSAGEAALTKFSRFNGSYHRSWTTPGKEGITPLDIHLCETRR